MILHFHRTAILGLLLLSATALQGCLAMVWLGAVGIDMVRSSDFEFQSFENSWMVAPQERRNLGLVKNITVMPFIGDPMMAERWIDIFREVSDVHVVGSSDATRYGGFNHEAIGLAQRMRAESQADYVLIGNVADQEPQKSLAGLKERSSRRLYLHLVSAEGTLMWKTELPFTIVKGTKDLDEAMVTKALLTHVRAHANELGLAGLGKRNRQTASRSLREEIAHHRAQSLPQLERP